MLRSTIPWLRSGLVLSSMLVGVGSVSAAPIVYTDRALFSAASTGTTTVDFEGESGATARGSSLTVAGVTFTSDVARMFTLDGSWYAPALASDYLNLNEIGNHYIDISAAGMTAIGFDFGTLNATFGTSTAVMVTDSLGGSYSLTSPGQPALGFVGFTSDVALTSVRVSGTLIVLDNVTTGRAAVNPVPAPGSLPLVAAGLAALALVARRRA